MAWRSRIFGDPNQKYLKEIQPLIEKINALEEKLSVFSDQKIKEEFATLRPAAEKGAFQEILPMAFALGREAAKRTLGQRHYDCQLQAGIALHHGKVIEMKTGEGKTLAATLPISLNALSGKGVHVVTVNDYLARRDVVWMGQIYNFLGLKVAAINHQQSFLYDSTYSKDGNQDDKTRDELGSFKVVTDYLRPCSRRQAYHADITYGTNNEFGFDYLRDNMVVSQEQKAQRDFSYAVIDEVDSILIDEARTPLIISQPETGGGKLYPLFVKLAERLKSGGDYNVDRKMRTINLIEEGIEKTEKSLGIENLYDPQNENYLHHIRQAIKAKELFLLDEAYVVKDNQIMIVDEFTGRLLPGRRYSEGLHQAIEAKEGVEIKPEAKTLATITFQNLFRMYPKLAGMTGTALSAAEEFDKVYNLDVKVIPTHKPMVRKNLADKIYGKEEVKLRAIVEKVKELHQKGQPVLIGTTSIEKNEYLNAILKREGIPIQILNAKNHEQEAQIIAQAGQKGRVTVATNMAGRGVDIVLGGNPSTEEEHQKVVDLGGLFVLGTERHEARRIDNQLRGRSGRQGEPGVSQFYISLKSDVFPEAKNVIKQFGGERMESLMEKFHFPEEEAIENKMVSRAIESAQRRIEGMNFDMRKRLLEYDDVVNKHRQAIYQKRTKIMEDFRDSKKGQIELEKITQKEILRLVEFHAKGELSSEWNLEEIAEEVKAIFSINEDVNLNLVKLSSQKEIDRKKGMIGYLDEIGNRIYQEKTKTIGEEKWRDVSKLVLLKMLDNLWVQHLDNMDSLKQSVGLRAYGQRDPLVEYKTEGHRMFQNFMLRWESIVTRTIFKVKLRT